MRQETQAFVNTRLLIGLWLVWLPVLSAAERGTNAFPAKGSAPADQARVVVVEDEAATRSFKPQLDVLRRMVDLGLMRLTGKAGPTEAWRSLASTNAVLGLKVVSAPGPISGTRPAVVEALVQSLLEAGWPTNRLLIWDKQLVNLRLAGFMDLGDKYHVRVASSADAGYDTNHFYESSYIGSLVWGDMEFGQKGPGVGRKSYVSKLVTQEMTNIISIAPLLNHNHTGVNGHLLSVAHGSVDNTVRFANESSQLALAVPETFALPILGDRVILNVTDALVGQYSGEESILLHYSGILNQLRFGRDPVALDVLSIKELDRLRAADGKRAAPTDPSLYRNAELVEIGVSDPERIQVETVRLP